MYHFRGKKGIPSQRIASYLAAVRHKLSMRLTDLSFMEKSKGEILATLRTNQCMVKLPAPDELTDNALQRLWIEGAVALCIIFIDITGNRSCNLIKCRRSDHTVRAEQVTVSYRSASGT